MDIQRLDPYQMRAEGLTRLLRPEELSRALFHLAKRRGFKSNRKDASDKERSMLHQEATAFEAEIQSAGCRTIGEYLWKIQQEEKGGKELTRLRCRRTLRRMYDKEFHLLVATQQSKGFSGLTQDKVERIKQILFYQRSYELPESRRAARIGCCSLLPPKPRCPKAHPKAIEFRVLKDIAHLRLENRLTGELLQLSPEQIDVVHGLLSCKKKVSFDQIKKALDLFQTWRKRRRFSQTAVADIDTFIDRQLNDTRYASRAAREYAELLFAPEDRKGGQRVLATKGAFLGILRRQWNFPKNRGFHYHHAEDAILNGLTTPRLLKKLAEVKKGYAQNFHLPMPQPDLPEMIKRATARIIVSHMQRNRLSGPLHEQTSYSLPKREFVHRVRLDAITLAQLENIRDPAIKALAYEHLRAKGVTPEDAAAVKAAVKNGVFSDLKMKSGVPVRKVRITEAHSPSSGVELKDKRTGTPYRFTLFGNNYALIAPKSEEEPKKVRILSMFEASARLRKNGEKALSDIRQANGIMLCKGDSVKVGEKYFHVTKISTTPSGGPYVEFRRHDFAGEGKASKDGETLLRITNNQALLQKVRKSIVGILGQHAE